MDMDTRLLRHFTAVAHEGDLARAARRLCLPQPALTRQIRQIRQLETRLGTELFTRTPAGLALTEAGTALVAAAPAVLDAWGAARSAARSATRGAAARAQRVLRVGFVTGVVGRPVACARGAQVPPVVRDFVRVCVTTGDAPHPEG
ncbi:helix-turn-helix domain-containing protein [Streptomyces aureocirculatus]|uniref:helix-turn-helix domain-containing protein n=1 Tax=Streptomyces aureocirculatus TaxID=67275 RepID=UPI00099BF2EA|nr:LysR family transcriptional regulator [Streptomyces aureocirculatus]